MPSKLPYLRAQAAAHLAEADVAKDEREAARLVLLAAHCQETIHALEQTALAAPTPHRKRIRSARGRA